VKLAAVLFLAGIAGVCLVAGLREILRILRVGYLAAPGTVIAAGPGPGRPLVRNGTVIPTHQPAVRYTFRHGAREFEGCRHSYVVRAGSDPAAAEKWAARHPPGTAVTVYFDPRNPTDSYLDKPADWLWLLLAMSLGIPVLLGGLAVFVWVMAG
jgi:hypothetical protein